MFYLIRHGHSDYSEKHTKVYKGYGVNLAPLTKEGVECIKQTALDPRLKNVKLVLSSPYTRALQTAAIIAVETGAEIAVETDLHEWVADRNYNYIPDPQSDAAYAEFTACGGVPPEGEKPAWEDNACLVKRLRGVLEKYAGCGDVAVACHGTVIQAAVGRSHIKNGEIVEYEL